MKGVNLYNELKRISKAELIDSTDEVLMDIILKRLDFNKAVIVCGIVYLEGAGTMHCPPMSMQSAAKQILAVAKNHP